MTQEDFRRAQQAVGSAMRDAEQARLDLFESTERVRRAVASGAATPELEARVTANGTKRREALDRLNTQREGFLPYTDPRTNAVMLDDRTPILLFPLRLETRFRTVEEPGQPARSQLWVRAYPDDCVIDSFEPLPSQNEIASAQRYWALVWRARGDEALQRAAWRALVASHGSGRAAWLDANYKPTNPADQPAPGAPDTLVLVIPTEAPLASNEAGAVGAYWAAIWTADGDRAAGQAAAQTLRAVAGSDARTQELIDGYAPVNLSDKPPGQLTRAQTVVSAAFVEFPDTASLPARMQAWSQPARARVLPDRLVVVGYAGGAKVIEAIGNVIPWPLTVGPDPQAPPDQQIRQENGEIVMPDELRWLVDFARAEQIGMGVRIDLPAGTAVSGLDRLVVLGVRLSADAAEGKRLLEELLSHHRDGSSGLEILRQGTPTNNTEAAGAGYTRSDEADRSFDERLHPGTALGSGAPWGAKRDGEWLAEALGVDVRLFDAVGGSRGTDQREAQAMNVALWPATLGYGLETMMYPLLDGDDVDRVRWFFETFVSGRGLLPAIRLGQQPYGILPTGVLGRVGWQYKDVVPLPGVEIPSGARTGLGHIHTVVQAMTADWTAMAGRVSHVGATAAGVDRHQTLLDIIGLHPQSVEFYQRYAESLEDLYNRLRLYGWGSEGLAAFAAEQYAEVGLQVLAQLGYRGDARPDLLNRLFMEEPIPLQGPLVEEAPASELTGLHDSTGLPSNYIAWLSSAARNSLEVLRTESGFAGNKPPAALLYLLLRHALLQGYWDSGLRLSATGDASNVAVAKEARREASFIHVQVDGRPSESRWTSLYATAPQITGSATQRVAEYLAANIATAPAARRLSRMLEALDVLQDLPTARLERLLAEHIDCCSYRLDAWQQGFMHYALAAMRYAIPPAGAAVRDGIFLGAFGWLEDLRPNNRTLETQPPPPGLDPSFTDSRLPPLMHDPANGGYIHAPSQNQAVAAAVLRSGYLANASSANPRTLSVNLSSRRVRLALAVLDGVRQGQSLGALLGYQLERGLHDNHTVAEVDELIAGLRKQFPLAADRSPDTATGDDVPIEGIEARNVVDGLRLVNHVKDRPAAMRSYPFGLPLPAATQAQRQAVDAEVERLLDTTDAVADLQLAESVYQAVQGNYDRVAATLDSSGGGQLPTEPDIVRTPRTGRTITHRVALHLRSGLNEDTSPIAGLPVTPRARCEPALNAWLARLLPDPADIACTVSYFDLAANGVRDRKVTMNELGLQPIDLLHVASFESQQAMAELDDRILAFAQATFVARPDCAVTIAYQPPIAGAVTLFELAPLLRSLRPLLLHSRPLRPTDAIPEGTARAAMDSTVQGNRARVVKVRDQLATLRDDLVTFRDSLAPLHEPAVQQAQIIADIDNQLDGSVGLLDRCARFGIPQSGWGFAMEFKRNYAGALLNDVLDVVNRWTPRLAACDTLIASYDNAPTTVTDAERLETLVAAEQQVRLRVAVPAPATLAAYRTALTAARDAFAARLQAFKAVLTTTTQSLGTLRAALDAVVTNGAALDTLDLTPVDARRQDASLVRVSSDLLGRIRRLVTELENTRLGPADAALAKHAASSDDAARAQLLIDAAKALLGAEVLFVPEFRLDDVNGTAMQSAYDASVAGDPFDYQINVQKTPFPIDTWLYGVARVREKMQHWESTVMLGGALVDTEPELLPLQLPWKTGEHWLGLEYPSTYVPDGDRLCYTAHFAEAYDRTRAQCGLLLDEWTEVVPRTQEMTGLTFHFDRPNAEAPQTLLLLTPPVFSGAWQWEDILDAVGETLDRAKLRGVEPAQVDDSRYVRFFPMTVMATTLYQISIATNLARNNGVYNYVPATVTTGAKTSG